MKWLARWLGLGRHNSQRAVVEQAGDPDPDHRARAAATLAAVPEPWAREQLLGLLKDTIATVRDAARDALRKQGVAAVDVLLTALNNADPKVAVYAAERLGELRAPEAIRSLLLTLKFGAVEVRAAAIRALVQYRGSGRHPDRAERPRPVGASAAGRNPERDPRHRAYAATTDASRDNHASGSGKGRVTRHLASQRAQNEPRPSGSGAALPAPWRPRLVEKQPGDHGHVLSPYA